MCVCSERKKNAEQKKIRINPRHQRKEKKTPSLDMTWAIYFPKHSCIHREKKIRLSYTMVGPNTHTQTPIVTIESKRIILLLQYRVISNTHTHTEYRTN